MQEVGLSVPAIPKRALPAVGVQVYDRQAKELRMVTTESQQLMREAHGKIMQAQFNKSLALCMIRDCALYVQWGYETFAEYVEHEWDFGVRQAYRYAQIGEKIQLMLNAAETSDVVDGQQVAGLLSGLGNSQWQQLVLLSNDELKTLAAQNEYIAPDGSVVTLKQIAEMGSKELREQISKVRERALTAEEKQKQLQAEVDTLRAQIGDDPTATGELVLRLQTLQGEIDALRGASRKREQATAEVNEATRKIEEALVVLRKYEPMKPADFEDAVLAEVMAEVAGRCASFANKLGDIASRYDREHGKWSGEQQ